MVSGTCAAPLPIYPTIPNCWDSQIYFWYFSHGPFRRLYRTFSFKSSTRDSQSSGFGFFFSLCRWLLSIVVFSPNVNRYSDGREKQNTENLFDYTVFFCGFNVNCASMHFASSHFCNHTNKSHAIPSLRHVYASQHTDPQLNFQFIHFCENFQFICAAQKYSLRKIYSIHIWHCFFAAFGAVSVDSIVDVCYFILISFVGPCVQRQCVD